MKRLNLVFSVLVLLIALSVNSAEAHKVRIFAYCEGNTILGETAFSGGRTPKNAEITVTDAASGKTITTCRTNDHGEFSFPVPDKARAQRLDLKLILHAGEGHQGEWLLKAEDYLDEGTGDSETRAMTPEKAATASPASAEKTETVKHLNEQQISRIIEQALDRKLGPIKRLLLENQDKGPTVQDIIGGLGWLIGLAGIAAYFKSKKSKGE